MKMTNETIVTEFLLMGFPGGCTSHIVMFVILLMVFLVTLAGNLLITFIICFDYRLHTPMYFFLAILSAIDTCGLFSVVPKALTVLITGNISISRTECFIQTYIYFFMFSSVFLIMAVMSFDRYVAICHPLRYLIILRNSVCLLLVIGCLILTGLCLMYPIIMITNLPLCGNELDHFFCDSAAIMKVICVDTSLIKMSTNISCIFILIIPLAVTIMSYICIVNTVIKIKSDKGRKKTFSTCVSHLTMVSIVFSGAIYLEIRPPRKHTTDIDKVVILACTLLAPLLNPFVYTLRNQNVKDCLRDSIKRSRILSI